MQIIEEPEPENQKTDEQKTEEVISPTEDSNQNQKADDRNDVPWV